MELELRFFATFREAAGGKIVEAEFADGSSVGDVLRELEAGYEGMNGRLIVDGGLAPQINVLKNGREVLPPRRARYVPRRRRPALGVPACRGRVRSMSDAGDGNDGSVDGASETQPPAEAGWERGRSRVPGISRRLAAHYLVNLGGELIGTDDPAEATRVDGDGWRVGLSAETVKAAGSISLTEVTAEFAGEPELAELLPKYRQKAMRAGG